MNYNWPLPGLEPILPPYDGLFGGQRKHDFHTGVDLYAHEGSPVAAIESGVVVSVFPFTGGEAGSPWWHCTQAVMVEGASGVILYGEVQPDVVPGQEIVVDDLIGRVLRVLKNDKGRPTSMLHIELYVPGTKVCCELWKRDEPRPEGLLDPWPLVAGHMLKVSV